MRKPDDCSLTPEQYDKIRREAESALQRADALGRFPTPVSDILKMGKLVEVHEDVLSEGFLTTIRRKMGEASSSLKRALNKVVGLFDARDRLIFIDHTMLAVKQQFVRLHEAAHGLLSWQRDLYAVVEDCEQTIDPWTADQFEREANAFASEVLFQLDTFTKEAADHAFGISVPLRLSKKYGASVYSTVRRYVSTNTTACVVLILEPPVLRAGIGLQACLRRVIASREFERRFGSVQWPDLYTTGDAIGNLVPLGGRKMSRRQKLTIMDASGVRHECYGEAFAHRYNVFILIQPADIPQRTLIYR